MKSWKGADEYEVFLNRLTTLLNINMRIYKWNGKLVSAIKSINLQNDEIKPMESAIIEEGGECL